MDSNMDDNGIAGSHPRKNISVFCKLLKIHILKVYI